MASFGAKYPYFNPVKEEPEGKLPTYKNPEPVRIGRLVKADLTVNLASGKLFADDGLTESVDEFSSGSIAMETDDMEDPVAAEVYGCEVVDKEVHYNVADDPPAGGLAYFKKLMRRKKVLYKSYFYPLVKAALGNDTAQTKTDSITFGTNSTTFTVFACETGDWRFTEEFPTEAEAIAWIKEKLKGEEQTDPPKEPTEDSEEAAAILAEQGELVRRGLGYDPEPMTDAEAIAATMAPSEIAALKVAIPSALTLGYGREIEGDVDEVDLGLAELNTQKKRSDPRSLYPHGDSGRPIEKGNPPINARRDRGPLGALPPGKGGKEGAGTGGRIRPEGAPPALDFTRDRHSKQSEISGLYTIPRTQKIMLSDLRWKNRELG